MDYEEEDFFYNMSNKKIALVSLFIFVCGGFLMYYMFSTMYPQYETDELLLHAFGRSLLHSSFMTIFLLVKRRRDNKKKEAKNNEK